MLLCFYVTDVFVYIHLSLLIYLSDEYTSLKNITGTKKCEKQNMFVKKEKCLRM